MEIEQLRQEINHLLENIVEHSNNYSENKPIPSLEISFILTKIDKLQEAMAVLRYLLEKQEKEAKIATLTPQHSSTTETKTNIINTGVVVKAINETVATLEDNLQQAPIAKLIDALSLNDRYLYANELFDKDMNTFSELVKSIDNSSSLNEAQDFLNKYKEEKAWDEENEHVLSFMNLVERRFL